MGAVCCILRLLKAEGTQSKPTVLCFPFRAPHRADAPAPRQRHPPEEQQPPRHHRGHRGRHHGGGRGGRGRHLHPALLGAAEEVRSPINPNTYGQ